MSRARININIGDLADGGVQEKLDRSFEQIIDNIMDPNTDQTKERQLQLTIKVKPNKALDAAEITAQIKTKLMPELGIESTVLIGKENGKAVANELKSGAKGQTYMDAETGELLDDTGKPVTEVEAEEKNHSKVINLQEKRG